MLELNGAQVPARERSDAEIYRQRREAATHASSPEVAASPTMPLALAFVCAAAGLRGDVRIPVSRDMTLSMVRDLAYRATGIAPFLQRLWGRAEGDLQSVELDQDHTLDWYGFMAGVVVVTVEERQGA